MAGFNPSEPRSLLGQWSADQAAANKAAAQQAAANKAAGKGAAAMAGNSPRARLLREAAALRKANAQLRKQIALFRHHNAPAAGHKTSVKRTAAKAAAGAARRGKGGKGKGGAQSLAALQQTVARLKAQNFKLRATLTALQKKYGHK